MNRNGTSRIIGWRLRRLSIIAVMVVLLPPAVFHLAVAFWPYPANRPGLPMAATWIDDRNGVPLAIFVGKDQQWSIPLEAGQISDHLKNAVVAVEDCRFESHHGVDWWSANGALWENVSAGRIRRGASTITMQLHRLRDPRPRGLFAKFEQTVRAVQIEKTTGKEQILVEYMNRAPFGGNLVGAGAASWRYFGRSCRDLSLGQAALLAGVPQNPNRYRPDVCPDASKARRQIVLGRMLARGMIDRRQYDDACAEPVDATWRPLPQVAEDLGVLPTAVALAARLPGQRITTTFDATIQKQVVAAGQQALESLRASGVDAAAIVVLDTPSGQCRAAASLSGEAPGVDLTASARSSGSTLKPLIYAAAFADGICTPRSLVLDAPSAWPGYVPANYDREFRGTMTAADALAQSRNIPAMVLLSKVGVARAVGLMQTSGLRTLGQSPERYGLPLAIGGAEVTPMELAESYATLGRGGVHRRATLSQSASACNQAEGRGEGSSASTVEASDFRVLPAAACAAALSAIANRDRTAAICPEAARLDVAWKTGTSSGHRDAWCAAVTASHTVVVWMGNPRGQGSGALVGTDAAAPLALRVIAALSPHVPSEIRNPQLAAVPAEPAATAEPITHETALALISPTEGQRYILGDELGDSRIRLKASAAGRLWWFIDGQPIDAAGANLEVWWPARPGEHQVRVVDLAGQSASAQFTVRSASSRAR